MKKFLFIFAAAACVALGNISCGSDDSDSPTPKKVELPAPQYGDQAASYVFPTNPVTVDGVSLTGINFTESGKAIVEVTLADGTKKYVTYKMQIVGNKYIITNNNGVKVGEFEQNDAAMAPSRSSANITVTFSVEVYIYGLGSFTFTTDGTTARKVVEEIASTVNTINIARTWTVQEMKLTLEGDVSASVNEKSGRLIVLANEAQKRGADLTEEEMAQFDKTIKGFTLDKNGLFSIEYDDETEACSWKWTDANQTKLLLQLRDSEFGNKFLSNNSSIDVMFYVSGACHFTLATDINTGSKKYKATLLVVMQ